jgi:hypothetical protein
MALVDVLIPHFSDPRVLRTIRSIVHHQDNSSVRIILINGGNVSGLNSRIRDALRPSDELVEEPDRGVFDALNKGLARVRSPWVGWLGSDDFYAPSFRFSRLREVPSRSSGIAFSTAFFSEATARVTRIYRPIATRALRLAGLPLPHFSTFLRSDVACSSRFDLRHAPFCDLTYFLGIERSAPRLAISHTISTYMAEGGMSNSSLAAVLKCNYRIWRTLREEHLIATPTSFVGLKLAYKAHARVSASLRRQAVERVT